MSYDGAAAAPSLFGSTRSRDYTNTDFVYIWRCFSDPVTGDLKQGQQDDSLVVVKFNIDGHVVGMNKQLVGESIHFVWLSTDSKLYYGLVEGTGNV